MQTNHLFRASLYALVCMATLGLWIGEEDPLPYPWVVTLCAVAAAAFTDHWEKFVIPRRLAPWLAVVVAALFVWEELQSYRVDPVLPLGHLLVYLQVNFFFHRKQVRFYWYMLGMSFLQMVIAAIHNNRLLFGILLALYLALALWTLTQFLVLRELAHYRNATVHDASQPRLWRGLVGSLLSGVAVLAIALVVFLLIPRRGERLWTQTQYRPVQALTGFDQSIFLGQLGTILESDDEVMTVHLFDEKGRPYEPPAEPLWRGLALTDYQAGRWERTALDVKVGLSPWGERSGRVIRQEIRLQPIQQHVMFALRPAIAGYTRSGIKLELSPADGALLRPDSVLGGALQYTVESVEPDHANYDQPGEYYASSAYYDYYPRVNRPLIQVPEQLRGPLQAYVAQIVSTEVDDGEIICRALLEHLRDSGQFGYTLQDRPVDRDIDPVLDFLRNRRAGHCEYFASALTLMLRVRGIPARVVNGFKGGDWNQFAGRFFVVRQKHAHSWVEAVVVDTGYDYEPHWITLDPTPGQARQQVVARVSTTPSAIRQLRDAARHLWSSYVVNYNMTEQDTAVYGPIRQLVTEQLEIAGAVLKEMWTGERRAFNWPAALLVGGGVAGLIFGVRLVLRLARSRLSGPGANGNRAGRVGVFARVVRLLRGFLERCGWIAPPRRGRIAFYDRLVGLLETHRIWKLPSATPRQFADEAALALQRLPQGAAVAGLPADLVDRFYRVRFGREELSAPEVMEIDRMLGSLAVALSRKE